MYYMLTTSELTTLQDMLFEGTERAFWIASQDCLDPNSTKRLRATHKEVAHLFIEAATELATLFDPVVPLPTQTPGAGDSAAPGTSCCAAKVLDVSLR